MRAMFEEWHLPTTEPAGFSYDTSTPARRGDVVPSPTAARATA